MTFITYAQFSMEVFRPLHVSNSVLLYSHGLLLWRDWIHPIGCVGGLPRGHTRALGFVFAVLSRLKLT